MAVSTTPQKAAGTTLSYKIGAGAYVILAMLVDMEFGGVDIAEIMTSVLASLAKTNIPGTPDNGDLTLTVYYVPADPGVQQLQTFSQAPQVCTWQVQCSDGTTTTTGSTITFAAWLKNFKPGGFAQDETPTADVTLRITGGVTFAVGT